ncbi:MAG: CPBP family intramembrane glutamic endopeptidase, partial [Bdellovibrionota bacterium]
MNVNTKVKKIVNINENDNVNLDAVLALIYTCIILAAMEYFFIPPRLEYILSGRGVGGWYTPSIEAGVGWSLSCLFGFVFVPIFFLKFVTKKSVVDQGFSPKNFFSHLKVYLLMYFLMIPLIYMASTQPDFKNLYPFVPAAKTSLQTFLIWELAYVLQFFSLEFFFRGYLLYSLERHMSKWLAIAVMVVPYTMIHFHKPFAETFGAIVAGFVLG